MHQTSLLQVLDSFENRVLRKSAEDLDYELKILDRFRKFVSEHPDCLLRSCLEGHITGSAILLDVQHREVVLTHHKKLNKWLQLGGHADGDVQIEQVAIKEAEEESGITQLKLLPLFTTEGSQALPFDLDIHEIPAHKGVPAHLHFDMRYLIEAGDKKLTISDESNDLRWFGLDEALAATSEPSMQRQIIKVKRLLH